jgi:hypothetical protein
MTLFPYTWRSNVNTTVAYNDETHSRLLSLERDTRTSQPSQTAEDYYNWSLWTRHIIKDETN